MYLIRAVGVGKVKIGMSDDVPRRLEELRAGSPVPLELVDVFEHGDRGVEQTIHNLCVAFHSHNEWFDEDGALEGRCVVKSRPIVPAVVFSPTPVTSVRLINLRHEGVQVAIDFGHCGIRLTVEQADVVRQLLGAAVLSATSGQVPA